MFAPGRRRCARTVRLTVLRRSGGVCDDSVEMPTVLIVDDHPSFRSSARAVLEADGFDVIGEAEDGTSALTLLRKLRPDVVLLDVQLPDMTGFDICEECGDLDADGHRARLQPRRRRLRRPDRVVGRPRVHRQGGSLRRGGRGAARVSRRPQIALGLALLAVGAAVACDHRRRRPATVRGRSSCWSRWLRPGGIPARRSPGRLAVVGNGRRGGAAGRNHRSRDALAEASRRPVTRDRLPSRPAACNGSIRRAAAYPSRSRRTVVR